MQGRESVEDKLEYFDGSSYNPHAHALKGNHNSGAGSVLVTYFVPLLGFHLGGGGAGEASLPDGST